MLDTTSEEFIQLLRDARDSASHAVETGTAKDEAVASALAAFNSAEAAATSAASAAQNENNILALYGSAQALLDAVTAAEASATNAQLKAWESKAEQLTANSYATEAEDIFTKTYISNGDGTFTETETTEYSSMHYRIKAAASAAEAAAIVGTLGVDSGSYIPAVSFVENITALAPDDFTYSRIGDMVTVSGTMALNSTSTTWGSGYFSLPFPVATGHHVHGLGIHANVLEHGAMKIVSGGLGAFINSVPGGTTTSFQILLHYKAAPLVA